MAQAKARVTTVAGLLAVTPLLAFAGYSLLWLMVGAWHSFPNAEDLQLAAMSRDLGVWRNAWLMLQTTDGRFAANVLQGITPLALNRPDLYWLVPTTTLLCAVAIFTFLLRTITLANTSQMLLVSAVLISSHFYHTPSLTHDLYGMAGSIVYMWSSILTAAWAGSYIRFGQAPENWAKWAWLLACAVLLMVSIGLNDLFLLVNAAALAAIGAHAFMRHGRDGLLRLTPLILLGIGSMAIMVGAPGTGVRVAQSVEIRDWPFFLDAAGVSLSTMAGFAQSWLSQDAVILSSTLAVALLMGDRWLPRWRWQWSAASSVAGLGLLWAMTFAFFWSIGTGQHPSRIFTSILYLFQAWMLFSVAAAMHHTGLLPRMIKHKSAILAACGILAFTGPLRSSSKVSMIAAEHSDGKLAAYKRIMTERYRILHNADRGTSWSLAVLPAVPYTELTVFYPPDLVPNRTVQDMASPVWNLAYEQYFQLDEVRLEGDTVFKADAVMQVFTDR